MEYLAQKLTLFILKNGLIDEENTEIYNYGFQCFLEISLSTISCIIIAFFLHMIPECIFFFLLFIPLRSYGGGFHMETFFACFVGSCLILTASLLAVKHIYLPFPISFIIYIISSALLLIIGPVDHPNRTVEIAENYIFRTKIVITLFLSFLCAAFFFFTHNSRYMFLQSIVFLFVFITSFLGHIIYKTS